MTSGPLSYQLPPPRSSGEQGSRRRIDIRGWWNNMSSWWNVRGSVPLRDMEDRFILFATKHWKLITAVVGLGTYTLLALTYDRYYGRLGLEPSEVGFGYSETLIQSTLVALSASVLLVAIGLTLCCLVLLILFFFCAVFVSTHLLLRLARWLPRVIAPLAIVAVGLLLGRSSHLPSLAVISVTALATALLLLPLVITVFSHGLEWLSRRLATRSTGSVRAKLESTADLCHRVAATTERRADNGLKRGAGRFGQEARRLQRAMQRFCGSWRRGLRMAALLCVVSVILIVTFAWYEAGSRGRIAAFDGKRTNPISLPLLGIPLVNIGARAATVTFTADEAVQELLSRANVYSGACLMYIGASGGNELLYIREGGEGQLLRVPSGSVSLAFRDDCTSEWNEGRVRGPK